MRDKKELEKIFKTEHENILDNHFDLVLKITNQWSDNPSDEVKALFEELRSYAREAFNKYDLTSEEYEYLKQNQFVWMLDFIGPILQRIKPN